MSKRANNTRTLSRVLPSLTKLLLEHEYPYYILSVSYMCCTVPLVPLVRNGAVQNTVPVRSSPHFAFH